MVQLKYDKFLHKVRKSIGFNSCMVQLKFHKLVPIRGACIGFNSCMVQLKSKLINFLS